MCSCTLIKADLVLTAAHCVASKQPGFVFFGSAYRGHEKEELNFYMTVDLHPNYLSSGSHAGYDIAVVHLARPYDLNERINIAFLPSSRDSSYEGRTAWATGFGTVNNGQSTDYLMKAQMSVLSRSACHLFYSAPDDDKLVCGLRRASICGGDSGSGLTVVDEGVRRVIGVASVKVSFSGDFCDPAIPSAYVRVSEHLDFLNSMMTE
jgi:trypsin